MRFVFITNNLIPMPTGFGSAIFVWAFLETLVKRGHEVHLLCYNYDKTLGKERWQEGDLSHIKPQLERLNIKTHLIPIRNFLHSNIWAARTKLLFEITRKLAHPQISDFYPGFQYRGEISKTIDSIKPDRIIAYTVDAVAATSQMIHRYPRMGLLVDLDHLARLSNRQFKPPKSIKGKIYNAIEAISDRNLPNRMIELLQDCDIVIDHAAHHATWLRNNGVHQAQYLPVPVMDRAGPQWRQRRNELLRKNKKVRLLLLGFMTGAATLPGLYLFAREVLPEIEKNVDSADYEINIIGGGRLPSDLEKAFTRPQINVQGFVEDAQKEVQSSDVIVVPTPIELGFRTRIAESFSFGCCVVAHSANAKGIAEAIDSQNLMLAESGLDMARKLIRCIKDPGLRLQLGDAARATFEKSLDGENVCTKAIVQLENIVK